MRAFLLPLACLALLACGDDTTSRSDSGATTDTGVPVVGDSGTTDTNGTNPNLDQDHDGYKAAEDCDDLDAQTFPGADEICDESDNDCDDRVDEGFDADSDGYFSADLCEHGDDCDDGSILVLSLIHI